MFRFDGPVRRDVTIRDVKRSYPQTIPGFDRFRFRPARDGCQSGTVARRNGFNSPNVAEALDQAAFGFKADTEDHASQ
jgi:hypothetical protein